MTNEPRGDLRGDCAACVALCCLTLAFDAGEAFGFSKPAGLPCPNLDGHACTIHDRLADSGFPGCAAYDCAGAGQIVSQAVFPGQDWRSRPDLAAPMAEAFRRMRQVQEMRAQLQAARRLLSDGGLGELEPARATLEDALSGAWSAERLDGLDLPAARRAFDGFLTQLRAGLGVARAGGRG